MLSLFRRLMKNNQGATVIEYTLIASLIAVAAIASMRSVGGKVSNVLGSVGNGDQLVDCPTSNCGGGPAMGRLLSWGRY